METETLLLILLVIILIEYILRLQKSVESKAEKKFQKMKKEYLADQNKVQDKSKLESEISK